VIAQRLFAGLVSSETDLIPYKEIAMCSVTVDSRSADGTEFKIALVKTGADTANITISQSGNNQTDSYSVYGIMANATMLTCTTTVLWFHPTITCNVDEARPPGAATVSVTVANAPAHNGTTDYTISRPDAANIREFIVASVFPPF
jgi:hypothetical protein